MSARSKKTASQQAPRMNQSPFTEIRIGKSLHICLTTRQVGAALGAAIWLLADLWGRFFV